MKNRIKVLLSPSKINRGEIIGLKTRFLPLAVPDVIIASALLVTGANYLVREASTKMNEKENKKAKKSYSFQSRNFNYSGLDYRPLNIPNNDLVTISLKLSL